MHDDLQGLAEAGGAGPCVGDVVVVAVMLERNLAAEDRADDLDVLTGAGERFAPGLAVPAFGYLRARCAEPEQHAAARENVERCHGRRRRGRRPRRHLHDRAADGDALGRRRDPRHRRDSVGAVGFGRPHGVEPEPVGLLRERDAARGIVVPELESEAHVEDPTGVSTALFPAAYLELRSRYRAFMDEHVFPNEGLLDREDAAAEALVAELQSTAREAGLWAPHMPPEAGGTGHGFLSYACVNEEIGRSHWAQLVFGCQAPDAGNAEILHLFGSPEQKASFLAPLVAGRARSFFSMTEPEVAGSDPTLLRTRAVVEGDEWVIDGHKWFSTGAEGSTFGIVFAITDPDASTYERGTMILVPTDTPGLEIVRPISVMGHEGRGWNTHCEVRYSGARVPVANTLGERGQAFRIAQKRLGPGRIHHVMRWLGQMQRAFDLMCSYSLEREAFGGPLADKQTVQNWIADSAAGIQASRLLTMDAARKIDEGSEARVEVSLLKFYAAGVLSDVIDRAIQVHGAQGLTDGTPLARMAMHARAGRIYDGPDEVHRMVVARRILKSYSAGEPWRFD